MTGQPLTPERIGYSDKHSHEPEIPPAWSEDGRCLICSMRVALDAARAEVARLKAALAEREDAIRHVIDASPGTPQSVKQYLGRSLRGGGQEQPR